MTGDAGVIERCRVGFVTDLSYWGGILSYGLRTQERRPSIHQPAMSDPGAAGDVMRGPSESSQEQKT
jgi:hypothetical protein